ncbi:MAG: hypothetical protein JJ964_04815 [Rhizobiales bacterium]|nr:hypothetical protein [Hyphomicrobiales bacterium]
MTRLFILLFLLLSLNFNFSRMAHAACKIDYSDKNGVYASLLHDFVAGYWIKLKGPLSMDFGNRYREPKALHMSRLVNPARRVLGCPKATLEGSLTLGHEGYVVVGPSKCFKNGKGPDIIIHEPRSDINWNETFNVYVTDDEKGKGPWYQVASHSTVSKHDNFLALELDGIVNARGVPMEEFRWVKIEDANSKLVLSNPRFSGFDVSAVKFMHECAVPLS